MGSLLPFAVIDIKVRSGPKASPHTVGANVRFAAKRSKPVMPHWPFADIRFEHFACLLPAFRHLSKSLPRCNSPFSTLCEGIRLAETSDP